VTPLSNGTPSTAASARPASSILGNLAKVAGPVNLGTFVASTWPTRPPSLILGTGAVM